MLRTLFVLGLVALGIRHALRGPFYAVLFYLWIAYFRPESWVWGDSFVQDLNLSLLVGVYTLGVGVMSGRAFKTDGRLLLLVLFLAQSTASTFASPYMAYSWPYWMDFVKSTIITYLLAVLTDDVQKLRLAFLTMTLSLGFESAKQGWLQLMFVPGEKNFNEIAFLGDNNGVAVGMFMLVPLVIALFQTATTKWGKRAFVALNLGIIYRGISTYSRGGLLTCAAVAGLSVLRAKRKGLALGAALVVTLALIPVLSDAYFQRMSSIRLDLPTQQVTKAISADDASSLSRLHFWRVAIAMAQANPLLGVGHNAFVAAYNYYDDLQGFYGKGRSVHSSWFGVLAELGFPGIILFALIFFLAIRTGSRIRKAAKTNARMQELVPYATAIQSSLIAFSVGGAFVIFQYTELLWHVVGLSIAVDRLAAQYAAESVVAPAQGPSSVRALAVPSGRLA